MIEKTVNGITLSYDLPEQQTADLIGQCCEKACQLAKEIWGLAPPEDCRVYVMDSWSGFVFRSAPTSWRILLGATILLWLPRVRRTWALSAAWTQKYGKRVAIGVKPPRLLDRSDRSTSSRFFVREADQTLTLRSVTCHELVHACSAHLRLPMWLNEGIAMVTVDLFSGKPSVRRDTLEIVRRFLPKRSPPTYRELSRMGTDALGYHTVRGYWMVRYLEEIRPGLLREVFSSRRDPKWIDRHVAMELGIKPDSLWVEIDDVVAHHFERGQHQRSG